MGGSGSGNLPRADELVGNAGIPPGAGYFAGLGNQVAGLSSKLAPLQTSLLAPALLGGSKRAGGGSQTMSVAEASGAVKGLTSGARALSLMCPTPHTTDTI